MAGWSSNFEGPELLEKGIWFIFYVIRGESAPVERHQGEADRGQGQVEW